MSVRVRNFIVGTGFAVAAFAALAPSSATAGIVVLKNGEVLVGRIRADEDTADELIMRWPYKEKTERGEIKIPKFRVRWYDRDADEPTDAYWEKYENEPIDSQWLPFLERWRIRKKAETDMPDVAILEGFDSPRGKLSPIPVQTRDFEIRKPDGWTSSTEDGITIFVSDQAGADGYKARVHVFAVPSMRESSERQVEWVQREIGRLGAGAGHKFEVKEMKRLKPVRGGFDQEMLTLTVRTERNVSCLRQVSFRDKRTYFFAAYADERDYSGLEILFKACMRSLVILEDQRAGAPAAGGGGGGGASTTTGGIKLDDATAMIGEYNLVGAVVNGQDMTDPRNAVSFRGELTLGSGGDYSFGLRSQHRSLERGEGKGRYTVSGDELRLTNSSGETEVWTFSRSTERLVLRHRDPNKGSVELMFVRR